MLIIGSQAAIFHKLTDKKANDTDVIGTFSELQSLIRAVKEESGIQISRPLGRKGDKWHIRDGNGWNYEFEIAFQGTSAARLLEIEGVVEGQEAFASKQALLALKMSHRYLRNSPHFLKTMRDIRSMRAAGIVLDETMQEWLAQREEETYDYAHPNLNVDKGTFFDDSVKYIYCHDSIHETVALLDKPSYTFYMKDGAQVMTDKEKFFSVSEQVRLYGVYEESCVLALERSQIPFDFEPDPRYSFELALMKVCTSITSGWFRQYAYESYDKVLDLYLSLGKDNYIERFKRNAHLLKPFKGSNY